MAASFYDDATNTTNTTFSPSPAPSLLSLLPSSVPTTLTEYYFDGSSLSDAQEKALALIPILTGALSAWGSAQIIGMVIKMPSRSRNCYNRIMLGLSCSDLVSSTVLSLQAFLVPADSISNRVWAIGTESTCSFMGFIQQLSMTSILYCGMLSWMYVLTIKYSIPGRRLSRRYEPWMHAISILYPLAGAIAGLAMDIFNEQAVGSFCWYSGVDQGASFSKLSVLSAYIFGGFPGFLTFIAVIVNNSLVYCHLRHNLKQQPVMDNGQIVSANNNQTPVTFKDLGGGPHMSDGSSNDKSQQSTGGDSSTGGAEGTTTGGRQRSSANCGYTSDESAQSAGDAGLAESADSRVSTFSNESVGDIELKLLRDQEIREMQREQERLQSLHNRQKSQIRDVAYQAFFYVAAFFITYLPTFILRPMAVYLTQSDEASVFPLLLLQAIFWPLQGLLNYLIYSRSPTSYLREIT